MVINIGAIRYRRADALYYTGDKIRAGVVQSSLSLSLSLSHDVPKITCGRVAYFFCRSVPLPADLGNSGLVRVAAVCLSAAVFEGGLPYNCALFYDWCTHVWREALGWAVKVMFIGKNARGVGSEWMSA